KKIDFTVPALDRASALQDALKAIGTKIVQKETDERLDLVSDVLDNIALYKVGNSSGGVGAATSVSAASFTGAALATESISATFGVGFANITQSANTLPLPTDLAGTTIIVKDVTGSQRLAPLLFVSPSHINFQIPPGTTVGAATATITSGDGGVSISPLQIAS